MKSLSTVAIVGLLFFACKLCSFSGNTNRPTPYSSPSPAVNHARDFIKQHPGRPYTLVKSENKEETKRTSSGFARTLIDESNDAAAGEYRFYSGGTRSAVLLVCNYSNTTKPASLVDDLERQIRASTVWKTVRAIPKSSGKRIEAVDAQDNGMVVWSNGAWIFLTIGKSLADATSLADGVGY